MWKNALLILDTNTDTLTFIRRRKYRDWLRTWTHLALFLLITFTIASFFSDKVLFYLMCTSLTILTFWLRSHKVTVVPYTPLICSRGRMAVREGTLIWSFSYFGGTENIVVKFFFFFFKLDNLFIILAGCLTTTYPRSSCRAVFIRQHKYSSFILRRLTSLSAGSPATNSHCMTVAALVVLTRCPHDHFATHTHYHRTTYLFRSLTRCWEGAGNFSYSDSVLLTSTGKSCDLQSWNSTGPKQK